MNFGLEMQEKAKVYDYHPCNFQAGKNRTERMPYGAVVAEEKPQLPKGVC